MQSNKRNGLSYLSIKNGMYVLNTEKKKIPQNLRNQHQQWKDWKDPFVICFKSYQIRTGMASFYPSVPHTVFGPWLFYPIFLNSTYSTLIEMRALIRVKKKEKRKLYSLGLARIFYLLIFFQLMLECIPFRKKWELKCCSYLWIKMWYIIQGFV